MVKIGFFRGLKVKNLKKFEIKVKEQALIYFTMNCKSKFKKLKLLEYFLKYWNPRKMSIFCSYFFNALFSPFKSSFFEKVCLIKNKIHAILYTVGLSICRNYIFLKDFWRFENSVQTFVHGPVQPFYLCCLNRKALWLQHGVLKVLLSAITSSNIMQKF